MNSVQLIGRLAADPKVTDTPGGRQVANFRLVTNHQFMKDGELKEVAEYHRVVAWGPRAQAASKLVKGQTVLIYGRLQTRSWELDLNVKQYRTEVVADFIFGMALTEETKEV